MSMRTHHRTPDCGCGLPGETLVFGVQADACFPSTPSIRPSTSWAAATSLWASPSLAAAALFFATLGFQQRGRRPQHPHPARPRGEAASVCPWAAPTVQHLGFEVASEEHLDNKAARYFKARRVAPAFVERAHPAPILRGSLPATAVGRAGAGVERRLAWFAAKVVVDQDAFGIYPTFWCGTATPH
jgi:hypothetical protein